MGSAKKTISYRFDAVGNRVGMTDPDGGRFTYSYDAGNRISHLVNPQGDRTTYAYDPGGRRTVKKLANGTRASFSYDAASNLTQLANLKSDGTTISSFNYEYDRVGNRTAVLEVDGSRVTWSYDDTYQLTGEHRSGTTPYEDSYSYDAAGNRLLKIHDGARTSYSYDAANQLEYSEDASGRTTYTFDADGNQELVVEPTGDRTTSSWDYENRTTLVQLPSGIRNTMAYEPRGLLWVMFFGDKPDVWPGDRILCKIEDVPDVAEIDVLDVRESAADEEPIVYALCAPTRWNPAAVLAGRVNLVAPVTESEMYLRYLWGMAAAAGGEVRIPDHYMDPSNEVPPLYIERLKDGWKVSVPTPAPAEKQNV